MRTLLAALLLAGTVASAEDCSVGMEYGAGRMAPAPPADSPDCRLLQEAQSDFDRLLAASGLSPERYRLAVRAETGALDAWYDPETRVVRVNAPLLVLSARVGAELRRGALAHEIGHAVQLARGEDPETAPGPQFEGGADAVAADLLQRAGMGGAATLRRMLELIFGCDVIRRSLDDAPGDHPTPGTRWRGADGLASAQEAVRRLPAAARRVLEGDPAAEAAGALFPGSERASVMAPAVELRDVTPDGLALPHAAAQRELSVPGRPLPRRAATWLAHARAQAQRLDDPAAAAAHVGRNCTPAEPLPSPL